MSAIPGTVEQPAGADAFAQVVTYVHSLTRIYEAEAQRGVSEGERLLDFMPLSGRPVPDAAFDTRLEGIGYALRCVAQILRLCEGPGFLPRVALAVESRYGWPSAALLRTIWADLLDTRSR